MPQILNDLIVKDRITALELMPPTNGTGAVGNASLRVGNGHFVNLNLSGTLTIASTALVTNLNAQFLNGQPGSAYLLRSGGTLTGNVIAGSFVQQIITYPADPHLNISWPSGGLYMHAFEAAHGWYGAAVGACITAKTSHNRGYQLAAGHNAAVLAFRTFHTQQWGSEYGDSLVGPWFRIWHQNNQGAGSTMDSDLLDGQHGSYYQNASNINTGVLADAQIPNTVIRTTGDQSIAGSLEITRSTAGAVLHVSGTAGTPEIRLGSGSTGGGNNTYLSIYRTAATGGSIAIGAFNAGFGGTNLLLNPVNGGNVGIGTSAPLEKLHVVGGNMQLSVNLTNNTDKFNMFRASQYASDANPSGFVIVHARADVSSNRLRFGGSTVTGNSATHIQFYTAANTTTTSGSLRATITPEGFFGIGVEAPSERLEVGGSISILATSPMLFFDNTVAKRTVLQLWTDNYLFLDNRFTGPIQLRTSTTAGSAEARITVTSAGNVGIGTVNPARLLDISASGGLAQLNLTRTNSSTTGPKGAINAVDSSSFYVAQLSFVPNGSVDNSGEIYFRTSEGAAQTNPSDLPLRMRITGAGNVSIGTGAPSERLDVNGRVRVRTVDNGTGNFATFNANGVLTLRTPAQVLTDIGASGGTGSGASGTWNISITGSAAQLNGQPASYYLDTSTSTQTKAGNLTVGNRGDASRGYVSFISGHTDNKDNYTGYIAFFSPTGDVRRGYIGWGLGSGGNILIQSEGGWRYRFNVVPTINGDDVLHAGSNGQTKAGNLTINGNFTLPNQAVNFNNPTAPLTAVADNYSSYTAGIRLFAIDANTVGSFNGTGVGSLFSAIGNNIRGFQLAINHVASSIAFRGVHTSYTDGLSPWTFLWHSVNFNPADKADTSIVLTAGDGLTGGGNLTANRTFAVDSTVVRTVNNQTIGGIKTFSESPVVYKHIYQPSASCHGFAKMSVAVGWGNNIPNRKNWLIATLPATDNGTSESVVFTFHGGRSSAAEKIYGKIRMGNRGGFVAFFEELKGIAQSNIGIEAYREDATSPVHVYIFTTSTFINLFVECSDNAWSPTRVQFFSNPVESDNTPPGTLVFSSITATPFIRVLNTGNVGIGTSAPTERLHVTGNGLFSGTIAASNFTGSSTGTNTGNVTLSGENYLSLSGQVITANSINLSGSHVTGTLASVRVSGSYTGITGTGALNAGSITSGFGNIDIGASTFTTTGTLNCSLLNNTNTPTRDKLRVWNSNLYTIGMSNLFTFGPLTNEFAMTFQMNDISGRGWWWGRDSHTTAQGAMALDNAGRLTVANSLRLGYGVNDTTVPGSTYVLDVTGNSLFSGALTASSFTTTGTSVAGQFQTSNSIFTTFSSSDADIAAFFTGQSTFGTLLRAQANGQFVITLDGNDNNDSFNILSHTTTSGTGAQKTVDKSLLRIFRDGTTTFSSDVGIGKVAPLERLDVAGNLAISATNPTIRFNDLANIQTVLQLWTGINKNLFLDNRFAGPITLRTDPTVGSVTSRLTVTSDGLVGINTDTPSERLDVNGRLRVRTVDSGTGNFVTLSATGVLTSRTLAQVQTDINAVTLAEAHQTRLGALTIGNTGTRGYLSFQRGAADDANYTGFIEFRTLEGTRRGYIGYGTVGTNEMFIAGEGGWKWRFNVVPTFNGADFIHAGNTTQTKQGTMYFAGGSANTTYTNPSPTLAIKRGGNDSPYVSWHDEAGARLGYLQFSTTEANNRIVTEGGRSFQIVSANAIHLNTGSSNQVTVLSSGIVGINTTSPSLARLHVAQNPASSPGSAIRFGTQGFLTSPFTVLSHNAYWDGSAASFRTAETGHASLISLSEDIRLSTASSVTAGTAISVTERFTILNNGDVGIGVSSPLAKLHVVGDIHVSGGNRTIFNRSNNSLAFGTFNLERLRITASGQLFAFCNSNSGSFTSTGPGLAIKTLDSAPYISFHENGGARIGWIQMNDGNDCRVWVEQNRLLRFGTNNIERVRIAADGKVGINNNNPAHEVDVTGTVRADKFIGGDATALQDMSADKLWWGRGPDYQLEGGIYATSMSNSSYCHRSGTGWGTLPGTQRFTWIVSFVVPEILVTNTPVDQECYVICGSSSGADVVKTNGFYVWIKNTDTNLAVTKRNGDTYQEVLHVAGFQAAYAGQTVSIAIVKDSAWRLYVNGVLLTTSSTGVGEAVTAENLYVLGRGSEAAHCTLPTPLKRLTIWNIGLTADEVRAAYGQGKKVQHMYGDFPPVYQKNMTNTTGLSISSEMNGEIRSDDGNYLRLTIGYSWVNNYGQRVLITTAAPERGARYRLTIVARINGPGALHMGLLGISNDASVSKQISLTGSWQTITEEFMIWRHDSTPGYMFRIAGAADETTQLDVSSFKVEKLGVVADYDCAVGTGTTIPDKSGRYDATAVGDIKHFK